MSFWTDPQMFPEPEQILVLSADVIHFRRFRACHYVTSFSQRHEHLRTFLGDEMVYTAADGVLVRIGRQ